MSPAKKIARQSTAHVVVLRQRVFADNMQWRTECNACAFASMWVSNKARAEADGDVHTTAMFGKKEK